MYKPSSSGTMESLEGGQVRLRSGALVDTTANLHRGILTKVICLKPNGFIIGVIGGVTAIGVITKPIKGARYELEGKFEHSTRYDDWQFKFTKYTEHLDERTGIVEYLLREAPGIGPKTATLLASTFGKELFTVLKDDPEKLSQVRGLSNEDAKKIQAWANGESSNFKIKERLYEIGLLPSQVAKVVQHYGNNAEQKIRKDCFRLTEIHGFGFITVAKIADLVGVPSDDPGRIRAAILYTCKKQAEEGHTCNTVREICRKTNELLVISQEKILVEIKFLLKDRKLISHSTRLAEIASEFGLLYPR